MVTLRGIIDLFIKVAVTSVCAFMVMGMACICMYILIRLDMFLFPDAWILTENQWLIQPLVFAVAVVHGVIFLLCTLTRDLKEAIQAHRAERAQTNTTEVNTP